MRRVIAILASLLITTLSTTVAFAAEAPWYDAATGEMQMIEVEETYTDDNSENADSADNAVQAEETGDNTEEQTEQLATEPVEEDTLKTEGKLESAFDEETQLEASAETAVVPFQKINEERLSEDGNYKLKVYRNKKVSYADIIKYVGEDKLPKNFTIDEIDGFKIRHIRSKAFSKLDSLVNVTFIGSKFGSKGESAVNKNAFFKCKKLKKFTTSAFVEIKSCGVGYKKTKPTDSFKTLCFNDDSDTKNDLNTKLVYVYNGGFDAVYSLSADNEHNRKQIITDFLNGKSFKFKVEGKSVEGWTSSNPDVISIKNKGTATILAKGKTTISVKVGKLTIERKIEVKTNPYLSIKGEKVTAIELKNGEAVKLNVNGKAPAVDNVYTNTEKAYFDCAADADKLVVRATGTGSTKLIVNVNGRDIKLKVKVLRGQISDDKMARIASVIGRQTNYAYADSTVMCSAYSYAYAYRQVLGITRSAGSFWCPGGCTWEGGTYTHYGSASSMLKAIKKSIDNNQACIGLLSVGASSQHYVTFYDYTGNGTSLSDFKILDPWDGNLTTGYGYGYSYGYHVVTVNT